MKKCFCGHSVKEHNTYVGGCNKKGSIFVCSKDNCRYWNLCDIAIQENLHLHPKSCGCDVCNPKLYTIDFEPLKEAL
jgi:hypothetical protein